MATCLNYNDDRPPSPTSSTTSSSSTKYDWELLESNINSTEIATYIKCNIPRTQSYQNNYNVKCYFCLDELECVNHKIKRQYRLCKEGDGCEVKYRVDYCKIKDIGRIEHFGEHSHELENTYLNENGMHPDIKKAIEMILEHNPTKFPKQIQVQLTTNKSKYGIENIKEPKHGGHPTLKPVYDDILSAINYLHYSTTIQVFETRKEEVLSRWSACVYEPRIYQQLQKFKQYFIDQWLNGSFNNWQIFNTPAGYSTTQNPEESFNGQIKEVFTEFERLTVLGACESMRKICLHYSENQPVFKLVKDKCNSTIKLARECSRTDFVQTDPNTLWYKSKYQITLEPRYCSCPYFIDEGTCKHHVGACIITNHVDYNDREFVIAKGKGRPKKNAKGAQTF